MRRPLLAAGVAVFTLLVGLSGVGEAKEEGRFVPWARSEGDSQVIPVTLPDGRNLEVRAPTELQLPESGIRTFAALDWPTRKDPFQCCSRGLSISYRTIAATYGKAKPIKTYRGVHGTKVPYYSFSPDGLPNANYLVFQFGPWMVQVYDYRQQDRATTGVEEPMTDHERATLARRLEGLVDGRGFLVLEARKPLRLSRELKTVFLFGAPTGPAQGANQVEVGGHQTCVGEGTDTAIPRRFSTPGSEAGAAWCDPSSGLHIAVTGTQVFVDASIGALRIDPA
jgi:hypothetical protein